MRRRWRYEIVAVVIALAAVAGCAADDATSVVAPEFTICGEPGCMQQYPVREMTGAEWDAGSNALGLMSSTGACSDMFWEAYDYVNDWGQVYDFDDGNWGHYHPNTDEIHIWSGTFSSGGQNLGVTLFHEAAHRLGMNEQQAEAAAQGCVI